MARLAHGDSENPEKPAQGKRHHHRKRRHLWNDRRWRWVATDDGEFPGLTKLDGNDNSASPASSAACTCALLEQWLGFDAATIIPGASGLTRPTLVA